AGTSCTINGQTWPQYTEDFFWNCMGFTCINGKFVINSGNKNICSVCRVSNDPHITTFNGNNYDWHGDCTYCLSQEGNADSFVYDKFTKCYDGVSCVDTVYFQPRSMKTVITIELDFKVVIQGYSQSVITYAPGMQVLRGGLGSWNREYPALAYWLDQCLHIISVDEKDFLVKLCSGFIQIYAVKERYYNKPRSGMCGNPDDSSPEEDIRLRNGTLLENPKSGGRVIEPIFAFDWT
ncbi:unnamed protein product, partial [Meganyctiphanes norvegica]